MTVERSIDCWREFAAAIAYVADLEQPHLTVWDALADALGAWVDEDEAVSDATAADPLRRVLLEVAQRTPEAGAPGGVALGVILEAAMCDWTERASARLNDGYPFAA